MGHRYINAAAVLISSGPIKLKSVTLLPLDISPNANATIYLYNSSTVGLNEFLRLKTGINAGIVTWRDDDGICLNALLVQLATGTAFITWD